ncbi:hypothetical protein ABZ705_14545 [Streptomyces sp. NPDC006984]|uniref:hypothetical protein n=1 Tax=Streptomyces sp. NPDC006984 TaxID=3155463 RepID=UPI0033EB3707
MLKSGLPLAPGALAHVRPHARRGAAQEGLEVAVRVGDLRFVADELTRRHPGARYPLRPLADPVPLRQLVRRRSHGGVSHPVGRPPSQR